jgi:hypothetical protein
MKRDKHPSNRPKTFEEKLKEFMKKSEQKQVDAAHKTKIKKRHRKRPSVSRREE